jgi:plasmid stability protein
MKTLLIREVPDEIHEALVSEAERNRRSKEKQALFLLEQALGARPAETCGELLAIYESMPAPNVDPAAMEDYLATRGRRSNRR